MLSPQIEDVTLIVYIVLHLVLALINFFKPGKWGREMSKLSILIGVVIFVFNALTKNPSSYFFWVAGIFLIGGILARVLLKFDR